MATSMFEVVSTVIADGNIPVSKYKSKKTGLLVVTAKVEGPLVHGYFCLATEAHDDDGLPHTLEHLVFMGSEDFPYKGALDILASRSLASGTNAWTSTDNTYYTLTTAGNQGFLNTLPAFLDHILYPSLTEHSYTTEVHHISGNGEDAGVVYCEVQASENLGDNRTHAEFIRAMYPGQCGYKSVTGGLMKNLRESTSHGKVCSYHKEFYRPENLCLIIIGQANADEIFKVLQPLEEKILSKPSLPSFSRPWQSPVPPLPGNVEKLVEYAADDETHGIITVGWRGPLAKDQYTLTSVTVILDYLTVSAISPIQRDFVEVMEPYCSGVNGGLVENSESCMYTQFDNVPKTKMIGVLPRLQGVIRTIGSGSERIDMARMKSLIQRKILDALSSMEDQPHKRLASLLIKDFLYCDNPGDLGCRAQTVESFKRMEAEPDSYWVGLINNYMVDKRYVLIIGEPSMAEKEQLAEAENGRVKRQRESLGQDGLKHKALELEQAIRDNEKKAPDSLLTSVFIPSVDSIHFHPIIPSCNRKSDENNKEAEKQNPAFSLDNIPFRFQLDDLHTNFVTMQVLLDSSCVPKDLKYFLPLYCNMVFVSPVLRNGVMLPHEEVISQLEADTLRTETCLGVNGRSFSCGSYPQVVKLKMQVEREKYELGVKWLHEILYQTEFPAERVKVVAKRMRNDVIKCKRTGFDVLQTLIRNILFSKDCNHQINSMFRQARFLDSLIEQLDTDPKKVEEKMEEVRDILTDPSNLTVHMSVDVKQLSANGYNPSEIWTTLVPRDKENIGKSVKKKTYDYVIPLSDCRQKSVIVGVGSLETSYLIQAVECVKAYMHEDLPAIMVYVQYLVQMEGPMWKQIRGRGLSYNIRMYVEPGSGLLYFLLARSSHIVSAYTAGRDIAMKFINGEAELNKIELESAKGSLIYKMVEKETSVSDATTQSLLTYLMGVPHSYSKDMLRRISKVTLDDLRRIGAKYIAVLFNEEAIRRAVCCNPSRVGEIIKSFKELGVEMKEVPSLDEQFFCTL